MSRSGGALPVHPLGPIALASLTTYWRGTFRVTVVAKTTFAFAPNSEMPLVAPRDIVRTDVHFDDQPTRSIEASSDLAPHLEAAEVLFQGHAHAPGGAPTPTMHVRLGLAGDRGMVLDKRLVVVGDRDHPGAEPTPFVKMRIGYERTAGGPGNPENPIGVGFTGGYPNVQYPDAARASKPAAFGPLSASWPCRASLLRGHEPFVFDGDPVTLPDDMDWRYFQAAPPDQWLPALPDSAWILLDGLHPEHASLRLRLPQLRVSGRLYFAHGADTPMDLRADTLSIDGPAERCTLTWRGHFLLAHAALLREVVVVAAAVHAPGQTPAWPVLPGHPHTARAPAPAPVPSPAAPELQVARPTAEGPRSMTGLPAVHHAPAHLSATGSLSRDLLLRAVAPFSLAAAGSTSSQPPSRDLPGAPWAVKPAPLVPQPEEHQEMTAILAAPWSGTSDLPPAVAQPSSGASPPIVAPPSVAKPPSVAPPPMVAPPAVAKPPMVSPLAMTPAVVASVTSPPADVPARAPPPVRANEPTRAPPLSPAKAPSQAPRRAPAPSPWRNDSPSPKPAPSPSVPALAPEPEADLYAGFGPER
jgi:hypothetical protein